MYEHILLPKTNYKCTLKELIMNFQHTPLGLLTKCTKHTVLRVEKMVGKQISTFIQKAQKT